MSYQELQKVDFPERSGIRINMMPFVMGDESSIPREYRKYNSLIESCNLPEFEIGKIGYLTIRESFVNAEKSQSRGGIHVERHPQNSWGGGGWGGVKGGLYMASTVPNSCKIWNAKVSNPGKGGDCSHLKNSLGEGEYMKENVLYWMTDETPHEAMPQKESGFRQFFRLVTSKVDVWYKQHSTENPLGIEPNARIIEENKFHE